MCGFRWWPPARREPARRHETDQGSSREDRRRRGLGPLHPPRAGMRSHLSQIDSFFYRRSLPATPLPRSLWMKGFLMTPASFALAVGLIGAAAANAVAQTKPLILPRQQQSRIDLRSISGLPGVQSGPAENNVPVSTPSAANQ